MAVFRHGAGMTRTLLHLGAGALQVPAIRAARSAGLRVVALDRDPEAPGRHHANAFLKVAAEDAEAVLAAAAGLDEVVGLYTASDAALVAAARVAARLNLAGPSAECLSLLRNLPAACAAWREAGLPAPDCRRVFELAEAQAALTEMAPPVVLLCPRPGSGIPPLRVAGAEDLAAAWPIATAEGQGAVLQTQPQGQLVDLQGCLIEGELVRGAPLGRALTLPPTTVALWGIQPAGLPEELQARIDALVRDAAAIAGIDSGPLKANLVLTAQGPQLLSLAPRLLGDIRSGFVAPAAQGWHPALPWFHHLAGTPWERPPEPEPGRLVGWRALHNSQPGRYLRMEGVDAASDMAGILTVQVIRRNGQIVAAGCDARAVVALIVGEGADPVQLKTRLSAAAGALRPVIAGDTVKV